MLSGGVDSTAILEAAFLGNVPLEAAVTVSIVDTVDDDTNTNDSTTTNTDATTDVPRDELYAIEAVRCYNERLDIETKNNKSDNSKQRRRQRLHHSIVRLSPKDLVETHSRTVIEALALWGYMETRNSLVMSAAFCEFKKLGIHHVLTGDNADELLGGSYDWYFSDRYNNHDPEGEIEWTTKRNATADLPYATNVIANNVYEMILHQPFRQNPLVEWATLHTTRTDCIDVHDCCELHSEHGGPVSSKRHNCGKLPLREAFCTVASWRKMDWIFEGSGGAACRNRNNKNTPLLVEYYETLYSDDTFEIEQIRYKANHGIRLLSKEHLHNIRIFEQVFDGFQNHPTKEKHPIGDPRGCVSCCFDHGDEAFCHLCDEYPAQHPSQQTTTTTTIGIA